MNKAQGTNVLADWTILVILRIKINPVDDTSSFLVH
jgi:hypothetical protein